MQMEKMGNQSEAPVVTCTVMECSYNDRECCCAPQIEVGDRHPSCDTFTTAEAVNSRQQDMSMVGVCHVAECNFNMEQQCGAPGITVTHHSNHADCGSFRPAMM